MKKKTFSRIITELLEVFERQLKFDLDRVQIKGFSRSIMGQKVKYYLIEVPKIEEGSAMLFMENKIREALQEWLENYILPQNHVLPYSLGEEELPKFYIEWVVNKVDTYIIYITLVDNDTAFEYVRHIKEKKGERN